MTEKRNSPYIWVTWITPLLAGDAHCEWAAWFKAHHVGYAKRSAGFDLTLWKAEHGAAVRARADALRKDGYSVWVENQNKFTLKGAGGVTVAGVPDIVGVRGDKALVVDCKTGKERGSDMFQVVVYMMVLPRTHAGCKGKVMSGEVEYRDRGLRVDSAQLTDSVKGLVRDMLRTVGGFHPCVKVPSADECRFCDITRKDCAERIENGDETRINEVDTDSGPLF